MTHLQAIAGEMVRLSETSGKTPVLITPRYLSLRTIFLVELVKSMATQTNRDLRIDWCRPVPSTWSLVGDQAARVRSKAINRSLENASRDLGLTASLQITASIARPGGANRELVIGWCNELFQLPMWTIPIYLSGQAGQSAEGDLVGVA